MRGHVSINTCRMVVLSCLPGDIWQCLKTVLVVTTRGVLLAPSGRWVANRSQGRHWTSYNVPDSLPQQKKFPAQNVNRAEVEKPWYRVMVFCFVGSQFSTWGPHSDTRCDQSNKDAYSNRHANGSHVSPVSIQVSDCRSYNECATPKCRSA